MGTAILILLGNGVVANTLLKKSKGEGAGWVAITAGWGFAVMCGIFTAKACGSPDGHLNPAVTIASAIHNDDFSKLVTYMAAQLLGAFVGAVLVWIYFLPHWEVTPDQGDKRGCYCTSPAIRNLPANFACEFIATFVLIVVGTAIGSKAVAATGTAPGLGPYLVGSLVWAIGLSLGGTTGYAINPVRDLGPRIAHFLLPIAGKGDSDWGYAAIPVLGPVLGGVAGGLFVKMLHF